VNLDVGQVLQSGLVLFLDHFAKQIDVLHDGKPELGHTFDIGTSVTKISE
jgi:hypothetical protein